MFVGQDCHNRRYDREPCSLNVENTNEVYYALATRSSVMPEAWLVARSPNIHTLLETETRLTFIMSVQLNL